MSLFVGISPEVFDRSAIYSPLPHTINEERWHILVPINQCGFRNICNPTVHKEIKILSSGS
jgi:hypothetical protein